MDMHTNNTNSITYKHTNIHFLTMLRYINIM